MITKLTTNNSQLTTRKGSTLLLALLVLSTVLVIAVSLSQLVSIEAALSRSNNETIVATYAAESALEQGAYRVRNTLDTTTNLTGTLALPNQASWSRSATNNVGALILRQLPKNLSRGFDFFNSDTPSAAGVDSVKITIDSCDGTEWIELGYQQFNPTTFTFGNFQKFRYHCTAGTNSSIINNSMSVSAAYRLYVRYVQGTPTTINRMTVVGCPSDNGLGVCAMPGVVNITAFGSYRGSTRTMNLVMPRLSPVSGVFNYGVFSECQIIKDPTVANPAC